MSAPCIQELYILTTVCIFFSNISNNTLPISLKPTFHRACKLCGPDKNPMARNVKVNRLQRALSRKRKYAVCVTNTKSPVKPLYGKVTKNGPKA